MTGDPKSVLELITEDWRAAGNEGEPSVDFIREWRAREPVYGKYALGARFWPGSMLVVRGPTPLDFATTEFLRLHPGWAGPPHGAEFEALIDRFEEREESTKPGTV
jgi:hypothetical protein